MNLAGRSLELFFIDGRPDGMLTAEVFNWTGHVLMFPRASLAKALSRREAIHTGVYLLIGEKDGQPCCYIGESEEIATRIRQHDTSRDWWTRAILATTGTNNLHKAHVKYLESRLVEEARAAGAFLDNGNMPPRSGLSEAAQANMEAFLDTLMMVLPALRIDVFIKATRPKLASADTSSPFSAPVFELRTPRHGVSGEAALVDGEFIVQSGSIGRPRWVGVETHTYAALHVKLVAGGVIAPHGQHGIFTTNYAFASPSAAAAILNGRASNGQTEWKLKGSDRSYKDWEQATLAKEAAE